MIYNYTKTITSDRLRTEILALLPSASLLRIETVGDSVYIAFTGCLSDGDVAILDTCVANHVADVPVDPAEITTLIGQINTILTNNPTKQVPANAALRAVLLAKFDKPTLQQILAAIQ